MKRLGIDVQIKYFGFDTYFTRIGTRGEPFDVAFGAWATDYADGAGFFQPLLNGDNLTPTGNSNTAYFNRPKYNREIKRIDRLSGEARGQAWADLDVEMMRDDPPWAPFANAHTSSTSSPRASAATSSTPCSVPISPPPARNNARRHAVAKGLTTSSS